MIWSKLPQYTVPAPDSTVSPLSHEALSTELGVFKVTLLRNPNCWKVARRGCGVLFVRLHILFRPSA